MSSDKPRRRKARKAGTTVWFFPETRKVFELTNGQRYYLPIVHDKHKSLVVGVTLRVAVTTGLTQFVTLDEYRAQGLRRVVSPSHIDQKRNVLRFGRQRGTPAPSSGNENKNKNRKKPHRRHDDVLWFPNTKKWFAVHHDNRYRVPVGTSGTVDVVYKRGLKQDQGSFVSLQRHPRHALHYTVPMNRLNESRDIVSL